MKNNLMNKRTAVFGTLFGALMITLTLALASASATGQQNNNQARQDRMPAPARTKLACTPTSLSSDVAAFVEITNNTGQTVPQGTMIYWETVNGLKGKVSVNAGGGLKPNAMIKDSDPDWTKRGNCSAYYVKK